MNHGEILNQISASRREALANRTAEEVVPAPVDTAEGEEVVRRDPPKRKKASHSEAPATEESDAQQ